MIKLLVLFVHLLACCTAVGAIVATDLRLLGKLAEDRLRIAPPNDYVMRLVGGSLALLYLTGGALIAMGLADNPAYLHNPKLQGKMLLVLLLTANAVVLHRDTFRWLAQGKNVTRWGAGEQLRVAVPVALSNSLWLYCAFLGIARPWNGTVPLPQILSLGVMLFLLALGALLALLAMAARRRSADKPDWIDSLKDKLGAIGAALG